jgi:threonine dehydrogenase-like Zn-dependent dehydrogenase
LHYDEITLYSLFHHTPEHVAMAFNALASGAIDPTPLISQRMGLAQVPQALQAMEQGEAFKVAITP